MPDRGSWPPDPDAVVFNLQTLVCPTTVWAPPRLVDGAHEFLDSAAGRWPLGLVAALERDQLDSLLLDLGVAACFGAVVATGELRSQAYADAAARLGASPGRCVALESSAAGARAAAAAGLHVVLVGGAGDDGGAALDSADAVVDCLIELVPSAIEELTATWARS